MSVLIVGWVAVETMPFLCYAVAIEQVEQFAVVIVGLFPTQVADKFVHCKSPLVLSVFQHKRVALVLACMCVDFLLRIHLMRVADVDSTFVAWASE